MSADFPHRPRVGIPYRTEKEELTDDRRRYDAYIEAVLLADGEPIEVSLNLSGEDLERLAETLDGVLLPGSPADVNPAAYKAERNSKCGDADAARERTDFGLLRHAFAEAKPVLAICYGNQSLNVFRGGSLIQDIASELHSNIQHDWAGRGEGTPEPFHAAQIEPRSRLAELAGSASVRVNSSHHQSILKPGKGLRIVARAADGVVEGVEWTGDANWVLGVQWHPERMVDADAFARTLFCDFVAAARKVPARTS